MALSAFDDKSATPQASELAAALGRANSLWNRLVATLEEDYSPLSETWKFYGQQWGWTLQLKQRKRTVLYLTPQRGHFLVGFTLGERAVKAAHDAGLPPALLDSIDSARKYVEGRGVRLEIRTKKDLALVEQLAAVKMAN